MRKLACLLVLVFSVPAFAVVFTLSDQGNGVMRIAYDLDQAAGEGIRGLALRVDVTAGDAMVASSTDCVCAPFNTFIDYAADDDLVDPYDIGEGHPFASITPDPAGGTYLTAFPTSHFVLSMAYLDQAGNKAPVMTDGYIDVTFTGTSNSTVEVDLDALRGGVIGDNISEVTGLPATFMPEPPPIPTKPTIAKTTPSPAAPGFVNGGRVETFVASSTIAPGHALEYQFTWGDGVVGPWGPATQTHVYTYTAAGSYTITVQARDVDTLIPSEVSLPYVVSREAVKYTSAGVGRPAGEAYAAWAILFSRPNCWGFKRNCRGDCNGLKSGLSNYIWVNSADLYIFGNAYNVQQSKLPLGGICADNNRLRSGLSDYIWVNSADLTTFAQYYNAPESLCPICDSTWFNRHLHFWTN